MPRSRSLRCLLALAASTSLPAAHADDTALRVTGKLRPPACSITLGNGGIADFKVIPRQNIRIDGHTNIGTLPVALQIRCAGPTTFVIKAVDNYKNPATGYSTHMLNLVDEADRTNIGFYLAHVRPNKMVGDGRPLKPLRRGVDGAWDGPWATFINVHPDPGIGFAPAGTRQPVALSTLQGDIEVELVLTRGRDRFPAGNETRLSGSTTLQLDYL